MRVLKSLALSLVSLVLVAFPVHAAETIRGFDVSAELKADRTLTVTETITYDFGDEYRHGIYRTIPETYDRNGGRYKLRLHVLDVMMDGKPIPWDFSRSGDFVSIKIGDKDKTITSRHVYTIRYQTNRAINTFPEGDEWYWNVTGNDWEVPIERAQLQFDGPAAPSDVTCFTGSFGSRESLCSITEEGRQAFVKAERALDANEGLTVAVRLPPGSVAALTTGQRIWDFMRDNFFLFTPFLVFVAMFLIWRRYGKEPRGRGTVIAEYDEPHGLAPAMLTSLIEQSTSLRAVTATLLDLARRGFLTVEFIEKEKTGLFGSKKTEYVFVKGKELDATVQEFEKELYTGVFAHGERVELKDLKGKFWTSIQKARTQVFDALKAHGYFERRPELVRGMWIAIAVGFGLIHFFLIDAFGPIVMASGVLSAIFILLFGWQMPRMTKVGAVLREEALGFKEFLSVTEKDRLTFTDAPERRPEQFARFLPAAVAFGVETEWAKQFAGIEIQPPSYIHGNMHGWTALQFAAMSDGLHHASAATAFVNPSSAGSGGSGFSGGGGGGGFGGGGGGSW